MDKKRYPILIIMLLLLTYLSFGATYRGELIAKDRKITIDFKDVDLLDVIRIISRKFNLNLIAGNDVTGKVTVSFNNVPVDDAFEEILKINGYTYVKVGDIIRVISYQEAEKLYPKKVEKAKIVKKTKIYQVYKIYKGNINDIISKLKEILEKDDKIIGEENESKILAWVDEDEIKTLEMVINELDVGKEKVKEDKITEIFNAKYLKAEDLIGIIRDLDIKINGKITMNKTLNSVIIKGTKQDVKDIKNVFEKFDVPPLQVTIEAKIVEVAEGKDGTAGLNWTYVLPKDKVSGNNFELGVGDTTTANRASDGLALKIGMLDIDNFQMLYKNLLTNTNTNLLSSPNITTISGKKATLNIGDKVPYKETSGTGDTAVSSYKFEDVGIKLNVTPVITEDGKINMSITPEVSSVSSYTPDNVPMISTRSADTNVIINNGQTLVIGGLIKNRVTTTITSIPILGDIPILGELFKSKIKNNNKTNLIIFITPKIIKTRNFMNNINLNEVNAENRKKVKDKLIKKIEIKKSEVRDEK
ncbi:secretin and TonB N-terminal domain-containing protein [Haliovirga abyssi]|uniref:Secretin/TonB short N-terminal domain-containing protein n=1 Tax=Haliovirga abyssi TaxID=2996794 RepID=A0AAU9DKJ2_9FUSO|nr:secretin and TonB N-terminal domain-containing protein [Haliovirga abyssi]BDU51434.1 hypothetical protein HLVA_20030 [Haliovirga abyssi]